jgi:RIO kinase 1
MRLPDVLSSLTDQGVIDEVVRPLKSGKEAQVYLVRIGGEPYVAKVYKDASSRSFKQRAAYTEGRRVRSSRDQRAMAKRTRHGKAQEEAAWKSAEVDILYRLHAAGVRVPTPHNFIDGVLLMELVRGDDGHPAPRLSELSLDASTARVYFDQLLAEVVRMLCAGVVHGDLSEYNVLVDDEGPVIIDFPQAVEPASNRNAKKLLIRDVNNLSAFLARCVPGTRRRPYGEELWKAYESNRLSPDYVLTGKHQRSKAPADVAGVLDEIDHAERDEARRRGEVPEGPPPRRRQVVMRPSASESATGERKGRSKPKRRRRRGGSGKKPGSPRATEKQESAAHRSERRKKDTPRESAGGKKDGAQAADGNAPKKRRRRRRRKAPREGGAGQGASPKPAPRAEPDTGPKRRRRRRRKRKPSDER